MSLLFDVPKDVLIHVLPQWCELSDLGRLDTAGCFVKERNNLLKVFCSPGFDLHANVTLKEMQFCADKGMTMKSIVLCHSDFKANLHRNILIDKLNTHKVSELQILKDGYYEHSNETTTFCSRLANSCISLDEVMLICYANHVDLFITSLITSILHNLKVFSSSRRNFGVKSYRYLAKHCKLLESVSVDNIGRDTTELDIQSLLINNCMSLKTIFLYYQYSESNLTDKTLQCVIDHCPRIEQLTLGYDNKLSLSLVNQLLTTCTALAEFRVGSASSMVSLLSLNNKSIIVMRDPLISNEHELLQFFTHVKQNSVMQLFAVSFLSTTTLNTIALHNCTLLYSLLIISCPLVTTTDVIKLLNSLPKLSDLTIFRCPLVDQQVIEKHLDNRKKDSTNKEILYKYK